MWGVHNWGNPPGVTRPHSDAGRPARTWACVGCLASLCLDISDSPCHCPASRHRSSHTSNDEGVCRESFCSSLLRIELISKIPAWQCHVANLRGRYEIKHSESISTLPHITFGKTLGLYRPLIIVKNRVLSRRNLIFLLIATWKSTILRPVERLQS